MLLTDKATKRKEVRKMVKKNVMTVAVYGDLAKKDVRIKVFGNGNEMYPFQNILLEAGYDCMLFCINNTDLEEAKVVVEND